MMMMERCAGVRGRVIIPGLPNEVALFILQVRLPRGLHARLHRVSSAWRDALQPSAVSALRSTLHISEFWVLFQLRDKRFVLYDPLLQQCSSPIPYICSHDKCLLGAVGSQLFFTHWQSCVGFEMYCFDALSMQWQADSIPLPPGFVSPGFASAVDDGHLYMVGAGKDGKEVKRLDVKSKRWEMLSMMCNGHVYAAAVVLQGRLHVIGGYKREWDICKREVNCSEIWDPRTGEWMLEPELWPAQLSDRPPKVAVVMDNLYALKYLELFHYSSECKLWTSLGYLPLDNDKYVWNVVQLVGVGRELWVFLYSMPSERYNIWSCVPTTGPSPLLWREVSLNCSFKIHVGAEICNVHV